MLQDVLRHTKQTLFFLERLCQTEDMFLHQKSMYMEKSTQNAGLLATKQHLEELVKEKNKRIEE